MARQTKAEKALDDAYRAAYRVHGNCVQVNMLDLGAMHREALEAVKGGSTMDDAVKAVVAKYRKN